ncbi:SUMF1/EgtB/PvdO family nonheme iron enzyme [Halotia branconii]|uniref:SUMF1/EgtB/PvdO family nonheme iron enzyme n=1 Tax=Halotia branconii CENA392 TaxID=1539056 RepID=A0AAJ6P7U2_9CYAN|nr:SUMF1/EgtB/PvdO family nonheme iron enzyme [Halotia branconii]WGV23926.1 SUMF1/EgtB/PvdO family nonheme iron enzyme [Halotia branconii CENA392]
MGRNWAIAIGINRYENLRSLNFAKRDASVMATWFQQEARFEQVFLFTDDSPSIAVNPPIPTQPTFGHLRRFLRAQFENTLLKPEDNLWFFFAGHGNRYQDKDYLMFSDSDPGDIEHTAISVDYVTQRLRRSGADNVVLFLDACRDESSRSGLGIGEQRHQGVITFYSCTANQKSWEIEELQHGAFTYSLLEALRLQGEANCATVERLAQYLSYQVPAINTRYGKETQNPYWQAEPPYKMYFILLEQTATLRDVEPLKYQASQAENRGDLSLAKQLWVRVLAVSRGDWDAIEAIERIAVRQRGSFEPIISISEPETSSKGGRSVSSEQVEQPLLAQKQAEYEILQQIQQAEYGQKLLYYQEEFLKTIEAGISFDSYNSRQKLKKIQRTLKLRIAETVAIEAKFALLVEVIAIEARLASLAETIKSSIQQPIPTQPTQERITRQKFLKWAGLGSAGLVTAVVGREIFKGLLPISVAKPKYILSKEKVFGLPLWTVEFETVTVDEKGEVIKRYPNKQAKFFKENLGNGVTLEMVSIPSGSFKMGSPSGEKSRTSDESPQHDVNVPAFFMGRFEVTQEQYQKVMSKNPSNFKGKKRPVEQVSWNDAIEFCKKLSDKTGRKYRLPSEAEWEYACRAGTKTPFHFGETITTELANYNGDYIYASEPKGNKRGETIEVESFPPNGFGLYDMHGNVWEWCQDTRHDSYEKAPGNGSAWIDSNSYSRLLRGGSWSSNPSNCRSGSRFNGSRDNYYYYCGFRVVCTAGRIL